MDYIFSISCTFTVFFTEQSYHPARGQSVIHIAMVGAKDG